MDPLSTIPTDVLDLDSPAAAQPHGFDRLERWAASTAMVVIGVGLLSVLLF